VWDRLAKQVGVGLGQLDELLRAYGPLIERCRTAEPDHIERAALAAMLHSFYTGIENLLRRVALEADGQAPRGDLWHRRLLDQMSAGTSERPAVIDGELRAVLRPYLDFRHMFRHAYAFELQWKKMREPVMRCEETLSALREQVQVFLASPPKDAATQLPP